MMLSEYLKPAASVAFFVVLMGGVYWFEHRSRPAEKETQGQPLVVVTKVFTRSSSKASLAAM